MRTKHCQIFSVLVLVLVSSCFGQWAWIGGTQDEGVVGVKSPYQQPSASATVGGRVRGVAWYGGNDQIWLYGGTGATPNFAQFNVFSDVWRYNLTSNLWTWLGGTASTYPNYTQPQDAGARSDFVHWVVDTSVYIYGGFSKQGNLADLFRLDIVDDIHYNWTLISGNNSRDAIVVYDSHPGSRRWSSGWMNSDENLVIFGGTVFMNETASDCANDMWEFDLTSLEWKYLGGPKVLRDPGNYSNTSSAWPASRNSAAAWTYKDTFWLFGGSLPDSIPYNDLWSYKNGVWTWISGDNPSKPALAKYGDKGIGTLYTTPGGRSDAIAWTDNQGLAWVFGGLGLIDSTIKADLQDTWVFNMSSHVWTWIDGSNTSNVIVDQYAPLYQYSNITPSARCAPFYVPINDSYVWFYGGAQLRVYFLFWSDMFTFNTLQLSHTEDYTIIVENPVTSGESAPSEKKSNNSGAIAAGVVVPIVVIGAGAAGYFVWRKKKEEKDVPMENVVVTQDQSYGYLTGITIHNLLGAGNFGEVFRGMWNDTPVALKKLKDQAHFTEFQKEAELLCSLKHTCIVQYYGTYIDKNRFQYIVTELMTQGEAKDYIANHKLTHKELVQMALEAAQGMAFIHSQNIIHRDLALRNLLVTDGTVGVTAKVSDFGMAKMMEGEDSYYKSEKNHHPIKWCSIETLKFGRYTFQTDVWAYGVLLWELFSNGSVPYPGMTNSEAADQVLAGYRMAKPDNCPDEIYTLMCKCWSESPKDRPTMDQIALEVKAILKTM